MKKRGFIFLEIIIGIFLLGLISVISIKLLNSTNLFFRKAEENGDIDYIGEMVFENLKSKDQENLSFLQNLNLGREIDYPIPSAMEDKYSCKVILTENHDYLWCVNVKVYKTDKGRTRYEEFKGSIPK